MSLYYYKFPVPGLLQELLHSLGDYIGPLLVNNLYLSDWEYFRFSKKISSFRALQLYFLITILVFKCCALTRHYLFVHHKTKIR